MCKLFSLTLLSVNLIVSSYDNSGFQRPKEHRLESLPLMAFRICQKIVNKTELRLFYIIELNSDPPSTQFIQRLHENSIQTISISHHGELTSSVVTDHRKNMIFFLHDVEQLFNLIFYTISRADPLIINDELVKSPERNWKGRPYRPQGILPRFCIEIDGHFLWSKTVNRITCCKNVSITSRELEDASILSDSVFNETSGLYLHNIWNFKNHLIFVLKTVSENTGDSTPNALLNVTFHDSETDVFSTLIFCFKFFWRFFKGQKVIICHSNGCERYDPFTENLISYENSDRAEDPFLDFSWKNMHKKPVNVIVDFSTDKASKVSISPCWNWHPFQKAVLEHFESLVNCTVIFQNALRDMSELSDFRFKPRESLKFGFDLIILETGILSEETQFSELDFSVSIETSTLAIATPHSDFMSQGLVIFKSFSPVVWISIFITIIVLCCAQYIFQYSQSELFHRLYTDSEVDYYRGTSSFLTVYAYFICGSPSSLRLGRIFTGKIIFSIFSFSALIITSVFLGGMTTLLSNRVKYPEIDSLKTLEESELFIQTLDHSKTDMARIFDQLNQSKALKGKLIDNLRAYIHHVVVHHVYERFLNQSTFFNESVDTFANVKRIFGHLIEEAEENVRSVAETDAVLVTIPSTALPIDNVRMKHLVKNQWFEYHLMDEYIMTYPLTIIFMKNSFYFDKCNQIITQYLETGHTGQILEVIVGSFAYTQKLASSTAGDDAAPRAFNLDDLQSAFIGLIVGLFLSFLTFVGELLIDLFPHSAILKFLMRLKSAFQKNLVWILNGLVTPMKEEE
ncbi:unnamed protein product [Bemisia tabaci]|uniref:Ionotropic receptor n=1 Tax=Bemisia tabaci TaxID=7038 RepID=A0A9P0AHJ6_BEMTA|nr:unnamed protein product [Bemisia tabaci]